MKRSQASSPAINRSEISLYMDKNMTAAIWAIRVEPRWIEKWIGDWIDARRPSSNGILPDITLT